MTKITNDKVSKAVSSLMLSHPFFACLLLQQNIVEDNSPDNETMYVDGTNLAYNSSFVDTLTFEECKGVLAHEVMHLALLHHCRMGARDVKQWNEACDYAINIDITNSGFVLPKGVLLDQQYKGMSAEDIYRSAFQKPPGSQANQGQGCGQVRLPKDRAKAEETAKVQAKRAEMAAKAMGNVPTHVTRQLEQSRQPKHDWRETLRRFLTEVCAKDYSFSKPNKRFLHTGFILPSLYSKSVGKFILAIDTSGSISLQEVSCMVTETLSCLESLLEDKDDIELTVIYCDAAINGVEVLTSATDKPNPRGGGGTDFRPPFEYVAKNSLECSAFIYMTDGECSSFPSAEPTYPVLWGLIRDNTTFIPPFGEVFKVEIY